MNIDILLAPIIDFPLECILVGGFIQGLIDAFLGRTDASQIRDMMLNNPMIEKMEGAADNYMDFGSEYYQKAKDYLGNTFSQQAIDQSFATTRQNDQNLASMGIEGDSGIANQNRTNIWKDFGTKAFSSTKSTLYDMWNAGQSIATQLYGKVSDIYSDANAAYGSAKSANAANTASGLQGIAGMAAGAMMLSDARLKKNITRVEKATLWGYPMYRFNYRDGVFPMENNFRYSGLMAQDVLKKDPQSVVESPQGVLMVDYDRLEQNYKGYTNG